MSDFWACVAVSGIVTVIVNLAMARQAKDRAFAVLATSLARQHPVVQAPKVVVPVALGSSSGVSSGAAVSKAELKRALVGMGWKSGEVERVIVTLGARVEQDALPALVRDALVLLAN